MKRTCNGCRALDFNRCSLGYKVKRCLKYLRVEISPAEECPKPRTYDKLLELKERSNNGETTS